MTVEEKDEWQEKTSNISADGLKVIYE